MGDFDNQDSDDEGKGGKGRKRQNKQDINSHFTSRFEEVFGKDVVDSAVNKRRRMDEPEMIEEKEEIPLPHNPLVNERYTYGDVYKYSFVKTLGSGAFSNVFLGEDKEKNQYVLKKLKMTTTLDLEVYEREIDSLKAFDHKNVLKLIEVCENVKGQKFLVLEYAGNNLKHLIGGKPLSLRECKHLLSQLLQGLEHVHSKNIMHRDLKTDNLMVNKKGVLKVGDFGSSRVWERNTKMTPEIVSLRYRAPEILLCAEKYDKSCDMWSVGCIFAEMLLGRQLIEGFSETDQIAKMCALMGSFRERWGPEFAKLPFAKHLNQTPQPTNHLKSFFPHLSDKGFDLLNNLLRYNPMRRLTATQALAHPYFHEEIVRIPNDMVIPPKIIIPGYNDVKQPEPKTMSDNIITSNSSILIEKQQTEIEREMNEKDEIYTKTIITSSTIITHSYQETNNNNNNNNSLPQHISPNPFQNDNNNNNNINNNPYPNPVPVQMKQVSKIISSPAVMSAFPPQDEKQRDVIDKFAMQVIKVGPSFEDVVKEKQKFNPMFDFLNERGLYSDYYRSKLYELRRLK
jgi:serine/threonine protein kinase